ncbi:MAG: hypothetical protein ACK559_26030, partial [bacterium]
SAQRAPGVDAVTAHRLAINRQHGGGLESPFARHGIEKLRLAVARHPGDGHHFAGPHLKRDVFERHREGPVGGKANAIEPEPRLARPAPFSRLHHVNVAPHHEPRQAGRCLLRRIDIRHHLAMAQD